MEIEASRLVSFGDRYEFPEREVRSKQTVTLRAYDGYPLSLRSGSLALADPWWVEGLPTSPLIGLPKGEYPTGLSTVGIRRADQIHPRPVASASTIGRLDLVATWQPLMHDGVPFHLQVDSGLGAFYDFAGAAALLPVFRDDLHMKDVFDRAMDEKMVSMDVGRREAAVVFECPDGPWGYPVHVGSDKNGQAVAVVVDLLILSNAEKRTD